MTIIEQIKAEIERRIKKSATDVTMPLEVLGKVILELKGILSFLSTLESEKPMQEELEEEYKDYVVNDPVYSKLVNRNAGLVIARHFAQWGAKHLADDSKTSPKDLEEAAREHQERTPVDDTFYYCGADEDVYFANRIVDAFIAGAKWQKEQMMKDFPKWRRIKEGERLPCPAYVWTIVYDNYPGCFEGRLMPNVEGVRVGRDTWYLPVDVIHNLPKED